MKKKTYSVISFLLLATYLCQANININWQWMDNMQADNIYKQI